MLGRATDPWAKWIREWNRFYLLACAAGLMVDPLFLYALSISGPLMCVFVDGWFTATVTVLRCMVDAMHVWNIWVQLRMARGEPRGAAAGADAEMEVGGTAKGRARAAQSTSYVKSKKGLVLDLFVILPVLQVNSPLIVIIVAIATIIIITIFFMINSFICFV